MERRRCFIGVVAFQGVNYKVLENYMALAFHWGRRCPDFDFFLRVIGKKEQYRARNNLVAMATEFLTGEKDVMLMLDDDMILNQYTFERLLEGLDSHPDAGVIGGLYWQRGGAYRPVIQKLIQHGEGFAPKWYAPHEITGKVMQVGVVGGGCLLIPINVLRELMPPVFWVDGIVGTDIHFCVRLNQAGYNVYCDTGLELGHLAEGQVLTQKTLPVHLIKYSHLIQKIEEDACEYLQMNRFDLETYALSHLSTIENYWLTRPRETFEDVAEVYTGVGISAIARNVFYANIFETGIEGFANLFDAIDKKMFKRQYPCLDYGCGIGVATEIMALNGFEIEAMDLEGTAVLKFLDWRMKREDYGGLVTIKPVTTPMPKFRERYSLVIMLDIIEHLMNPHEILENILPRIIPGGHFHSNMNVMDMRGAEEGVHQHLKKMNREEFQEMMNKHRMIPVGTFLYRKEGDLNE